MRSAPRFQLRMVPSSAKLMIPSGEEAIIAARCPLATVIAQRPDVSVAASGEQPCPVPSSCCGTDPHDHYRRRPCRFLPDQDNRARFQVPPVSGMVGERGKGNAGLRAVAGGGPVIRHHGHRGFQWLRQLPSMSAVSPGINHTDSVLDGGSSCSLLSCLRRREVLGQVLVHLEHCYLLFAKYRLQLIIRQDLAPVFRILQFVLPDIVPDLADDLTAR